MTKQEMLRKLERDLPDDAKIQKFAVQADTGGAVMMATGGTCNAFEELRFITRMNRLAAQSMGCEPKMIAGAVAVMMEIGGPEDEITIDGNAMEAAAKEDDHDDR